MSYLAVMTSTAGNPATDTTGRRESTSPPPAINTRTPPTTERGAPVTEDPQEAARAAALNELSWELDDPQTLERTAFRRSLLWTLLTLPTWALVAGVLIAAAALIGGAWWLLAR